MLQSLITVFREVFEIAVLLSVFLFSTKNLEGRGKFILTGALSGIMGAILIAIFTVQITNSLDGRGQEMVNIVILAASILMISWTILWMGNNSRELMGKIKSTSAQVMNGGKPKIILSIFIATCLLREGAEIIMFLSGILASGIEESKIIFGALIGLALGLIVGLSIYIGFLKIPVKIVFKLTSFFLIMLASGLAARLANMLAQAELVEILSAPLWDSSWLIEDNSIAGVVLSNIIGYYNSSPSGLEIIFYVTTFSILILERFIIKPKLP